MSRPAGWHETQVADAFDVELGKALNSGARRQPQWPYLANQNVQWGEVVLDEVRTMHFSEGERRKYRLEEGDILVTEGGEIGRTAIWRSPLAECYFQNAVHRLRADLSVVYPEYMSHLMRHEVAAGSFRGLAGQTSIAHLPKSYLETWEFPLPPLEEQRRIAEVLDTVDDAIRSTERLIAKFRTVYLGLAEALLADIEQSPVPLSGHLAAIEAGWSPSCLPESPSPGRWGVLKVSAVTSGRFDETESKALPIRLAPRTHLEVMPGDVLMSRANGVPNLVGVTCQVQTLPTRRLMLSDKTLRLTPRGSVTRRFLNVALSCRQSRRQILRRLGGSTGQGNISQKEIRSLRIAIPPRAKQDSILDTLSSVGGQVLIEERALSKLRLAQAGLRSDLLSGRIRTVAT